MKVALVHDWLIHMRGGEKVLESLAEIFPEATIYTLFTRREKLSPFFQKMKIKTSILQYFPGIRSYYPWLLPWFPFFIRTLEIEKVDLVISSSHCVAKGVPIPEGAKHLCYCHTPMRYLWGFEKEYFGKFPKWFLGCLEPFFKKLREWDVETSQRVDFFFCNSETVRRRIQTLYRKEAVVVQPPVDAQFFKPDAQPKGDYYFIVSAMTPYKRLDVAIQAFNGWDRKLLIAGDGPSRSTYQKGVKTDNIHFLGQVSDQALRRLYSGARAVVFPQEEDFGIVPLEAQACRTPVIAFGKGGATESVKYGVFFHKQEPEALRQAVMEFETKTFDPEKMRPWALQFDKPEFKNKISREIQNVIH